MCRGLLKHFARFLGFAPGSADNFSADSIQGAAPRQQVSLRSNFTPVREVDFDLWLRSVDTVPSTGFPADLLAVRPGFPVVFSFQRPGRQQMGLALVRQADGRFVRRPDGGLFNIAQLALARSGLRYELLKIESHYQWYRQNSSWDYEPVKSTKRVADGDLSIKAGEPARLQFNPEPGRYRLDVKTADVAGPLTSVQFDVGWYSDGSADTPDLLETSIDKQQYASGDAMTRSPASRSV